MNVKELKEKLSEFPDHMEVKVEHQKQSVGSLDVYYLFRMDAKHLEDNIEGLKGDVCVIRIK